MKYTQHLKCKQCVHSTILTHEYLYCAVAPEESLFHFFNSKESQLVTFIPAEADSVWGDTF